MSNSVAERRFWNAWVRECSHLAPPARDYKFHPDRGWLFDFAWPEHKLALEIDGRGRGKTIGRHHTVDGQRRDCEKNNAAVLLGWRIMRFPATDAKEEAAQWVEQVVEVIHYASTR